MAACGPRRLNAMSTPRETLMAIGYSADLSDSTFKANNDAQMYCERRRQTVSFLKQDTIYEGRYAENVTAGASRTCRGCPWRFESRVGKSCTVFSNKLQDDVRVSL